MRQETLWSKAGKNTRPPEQICKCATVYQENSRKATCVEGQQSELSDWNVHAAWCHRKVGQQIMAMARWAACTTEHMLTWVRYRSGPSMKPQALVSGHRSVEVEVKNQGYFCQSCLLVFEEPCRAEQENILVFAVPTEKKQTEAFLPRRSDLLSLPPTDATGQRKERENSSTASKGLPCAVTRDESNSSRST